MWNESRDDNADGHVDNEKCLHLKRRLIPSGRCGDGNREDIHAHKVLCLFIVVPTLHECLLGATCNMSNDYDT